MSATLSFRPARVEEAEAVAALVNSAYRGEESRAGWTTEADFLEGRRTDSWEIRGLIERPESLVLLCERDGETVGCVHLRREGDAAYLGMLVVKPALQTAGIGKELMAESERFVRREWGARAITMSVLTLRPELIAFYERRGYRRTGRRIPFPPVSLSTPLVGGLEFEVLEKRLGE